jgi:hypothetical protein
MRTTALGKTALTLGALLATGTAATAGLFVSLAAAARSTTDDSAAAADPQLGLSQSSGPTSDPADSQRAQDSGRRTSPKTSGSSRSSSFTGSSTAQPSTAPAHTKTKGS